MGPEFASLLPGSRPRHSDDLICLADNWPFALRKAARNSSVSSGQSACQTVEVHWNIARPDSPVSIDIEGLWHRAVLGMARLTSSLRRERQIREIETPSGAVVWRRG
jgi:hypothetical protein